ncbi:MAG: response regulator [Armatimonadetes bacterium]|nr:response regulator [Armatimonadota bacterium]
MASQERETALMDARRALIVQGERGLARLLEVLLQREGYATELAHDGHEGLTKARAGSPQIILLDPVLPKLGGHRVLGALRRDPSTAAIPVVMVAAEEHPACSESADVERVTKPFTPQTLVTAVRRAVAAAAL